MRYGGSFLWLGKSNLARNRVFSTKSVIILKTASLRQKSVLTGMKEHEISMLKMLMNSLGGPPPERYAVRTNGGYYAVRLGLAAPCIVAVQDETASLFW